MKKRKTAAPAVTHPEWYFQKTEELERLNVTAAAGLLLNEVLKPYRDMPVLRKGPGMTTVQLVNPDGTYSGEFKRMALIGNERLTLQSFYFGNKHGVIMRMHADAGVIPGVDKPMICEDNLADFCQAYELHDGKSLKTLLAEKAKELGIETAERAVGHAEEVRERVERETQAREEAERAELAKLREQDYAQAPWGAW